MTHWNTQSASQMYGIERWGEGYFGINDQGHVEVRLPGHENNTIDLHQLAQHLLTEHDIRLPVLVRFLDILSDRTQQLRDAFNQAIAGVEQQSHYTAIYPVKVNQQRSVVQQIVSTGTRQVGLEAGSKPELIAVLGSAPAGSTIVCNGYKDREYLRLALIGRQMGHVIYIVLEKPSELQIVLEEAEKLDIEPLLGVRIRLYSMGKGKWQNTGGEKSKFGLSAAQTLELIEALKQHDRLECLQLLHFHMGSQIANIRDIQRGMQEACRYFAELHELGVPIRTLDVGGGLGVDYEGSRSRSVCSVNYSIQEYANTIVRAVLDICQEKQIPFPDFMTESGRGITAHHAVLITNVTGTDPESPAQSDPQLIEIHPPEDSAPNLIHNLYRLHHEIREFNPSETYHEAVHGLGEAHSMYAYGVINLAQRAAAEKLHQAICQQLLTDKTLFQQLTTEIRHSLQEKLAYKYFCNFSLFQSLPDAWAIDQIFPVMPLHRLDEKPMLRGTLQDLTCDSDGAIHQYVHNDHLESTLPLHNLTEEAYLMGFFMVGAYQEILGDLHNLFGDTDAINIRLLTNGHYQISEPERGDTIDELLRYVHFEPKELLAHCRKKLAAAVSNRDRQRMLLREIEAGLIGYTYLED